MGHRARLRKLKKLEERRNRMGDDNKNHIVTPSIASLDPFGALKGDVVLTLKMDQFGNIGIYAPTVPPMQACSALAQSIIKLIFQSMDQSAIIKPFGR